MQNSKAWILIRLQLHDLWMDLFQVNIDSTQLERVACCILSSISFLNYELMLCIFCIKRPVAIAP